MNVEFKLLPDAVATAECATKAEVLEHLSRLFAEVYGLTQIDVLDGLEGREKLGSTGFGRGIAIPHARSNQVNRPTVALLKLENPVDFDSADAMPVNLVFAMLSPENAGATHLHALAAISRLVRDDAMHDALVDAPNGAALYALLSNQLERDAA